MCNLPRIATSAAYKDADGLKIRGRRILVDVERGRTVKGWKPMRLGGGLGASQSTRKKKEPEPEAPQMGFGSEFPFLGVKGKKKQFTDPARLSPQCAVAFAEAEAVSLVEAGRCEVDSGEGLQEDRSVAEEAMAVHHGVGMAEHRLDRQQWERPEHRTEPQEEVTVELHLWGKFQDLGNRRRA